MLFLHCNIVILYRYTISIKSITALNIKCNQFTPCINNRISTIIITVQNKFILKKMYREINTICILVNNKLFKFV